MRHEPMLKKSEQTDVIPAKWPTTAELVHLPIAVVDEAERPVELVQAYAPTASAPDVPAVVFGMLFAAYASLIAAFALATVRSAESVYVVTISALFVLAFFTVPRIFFHVEPKSIRRPGLDRFLRDGIQTLTGHCSGKDALIQMMIVPVLLTFAALAMGVAAAIYR
jgi:hypothetical protein